MNFVHIKILMAGKNELNSAKKKKIVLLADCSDDPVNLGRRVIFNFKFRRNQLTIQVIVLIGVSCSIFQFHTDPHGASIIEDDVESRLSMEEPEYLWF